MLPKHCMQGVCQIVHKLLKEDTFYQVPLLREKTVCKSKHWHMQFWATRCRFWAVVLQYCPTCFYSFRIFDLFSCCWSHMSGLTFYLWQEVLLLLQVCALKNSFQVSEILEFLHFNTPWGKRQWILTKTDEGTCCDVWVYTCLRQEYK